MHRLALLILASLLFGCGGGQQEWVFEAPVWTAGWDSGGVDEGYALVRQADGKFIVAGSGQGATTGVLVRFNEDGSLDTSFGTGGSVAWDTGGFDSSYGLAVQADGKIVVTGVSHSGTDYDFVLLRYNSDGTPDTGFAANGVFRWNSGSYDEGREVAVQDDGKIVAVGASAGDCLVLRCNTDGTPDAGFGAGGVMMWDGGRNAGAHDVVVQPDGKILVAGILSGGGTVDGFLLRLNPDGTPDGGFGTGGSVTWDSGAGDYWFGLALGSDGKIVVGGDCHDDPADDALLVRFNADGSIDAGFGDGGFVLWDNVGGDDGIESLAVLPGGKILATGWCGNGTGYDLFVLQVNADGSLDSRFGPGGVITWEGGYGGDLGFALEVTANGEILVAGETRSETDTDFLLIRIR